MTLQSFIEPFVFAVLMGALVGIEREHTRQLVKKHEVVLPKQDVLIFGVRTTILFSVLGFLCSFVAKLTGETALIAAGLVLAIIITTTVYLSNVWVNHHTGATTYIAMFIVFFMGVIIGIGGYENYTIAAALSITLTLFLVAKRKVINWTRKITYEEIYAALKFGIIAFIILPLLPNRYIDPWNVLNPFRIWYIVVLISAIYFMSYILMKLFARKGLVLSSFFGGLVSGSATTYEIGEWVRHRAGLLRSAISSVFVACFAGQLGDLIVISIVFANVPLLRYVLLPYIASSLTLACFAYFNYKKKNKKKKDETPIKMKSPFALVPALKFGGLYLLLVITGGILDIYFGHLGLLPTTIIGSLFSSSAVIASLANLSAQETIPYFTAAMFTIIAASIALFVKMFWIQNAHNKKFSKSVIIGTFATAGIMLLVFFVQYLFI